MWCGVADANDPTSATLPTKSHDCSHSAMAGFAAAFALKLLRDVVSVFFLNRRER